MSLAALAPALENPILKRHVFAVRVHALLGTGALLSPELQAQRLRWDPIGDNNDEWHYTFGIEENSGWLGHNGQIPGMTKSSW